MRVFKPRNESGFKKVLAGQGSFVVPVTFIPNFVSLSFRDLRKTWKAADVELSWDLVATATGMDLSVFYTVNEEREIRWMLAVIPAPSLQ